MKKRKNLFIKQVLIQQLVLSGAILLACTLSIALPSVLLAQTVADLDPGNVAVYYPDGSFPTNNCNSPATCGTSQDLANNKVGSYVVVGGTTGSDVVQRTMTKRFTVLPTTDSDIVLDARVTGQSLWRGTLYAVDFTKLDNVTIPSLGLKSEAFIRVGLVDVTDPNNQFEVGNAAVADFGCEPDRTVGAKVTLPFVSDPVEFELEVGWCEENSSDTFNFGAKVITGHTYELQMAIICQATTGFPLSLLSACTFNPSPLSFDLADLISNSGVNLSFTIPKLSIDFGDPIGDVTLFPETTVDLAGILTSVTNVLVPSIDDGFLQWGYMTVTIDEDVPSLIRSGVSEALRLLNTPEGQRQTRALPSPWAASIVELISAIHRPPASSRHRCEIASADFGADPTSLLVDVRWRASRTAPQQERGQPWKSTAKTPQCWSPIRRTTSSVSRGSPGDWWATASRKTTPSSTSNGSSRPPRSTASRSSSPPTTTTPPTTAGSSAGRWRP